MYLSNLLPSTRQVSRVKQDLHTIQEYLASNTTGVTCEAGSAHFS